MSVGQPPASTIAPYRSDAFAVAKNVFGWRVGTGSAESAVSSGRGRGATFFGLGRGVDATAGAAGRPEESAGAEAGDVAGAEAPPAGAGVVSAAGAAIPDSASLDGLGINGLAGALCAGLALSRAGLVSGETFAVGEGVACASAAETANGKQKQPTNNCTLSFIGPAHAKASLIDALASSFG